MNILEQLRDRFSDPISKLTASPDECLAMIRPSRDARHGDYQANFAMPLAKQQKKLPRDLATEIIAQVDLADLCEEPEVAGPGFINLRLRDDLLINITTELLTDDRLGVERTETPRTVVVDYSAPNVAKPMHVGHLRSTVIGNAIYRLLKFQGHQVISDNHIGDWGTQFGMIIYGYKNFRNDDVYQQNAVAELARLYRLVNQVSGYHAAKSKMPNLEQQLAELESRLAEHRQREEVTPEDKSLKKARKQLNKERETLNEEFASTRASIDAVESSPQLKELAEAHPDIVENARKETAKLHAGDEENNRLWNEFLPACIVALNEVYARLGIEFDKALGESFYNPMLADVVADLQEKELAKESNGAICVFVADNPAPFIIRKADGAFTYATTDLATVKYRIEELNANEILYVVDSRQTEHFRLLFTTAGNWGFDAQFRHVSFGSVLGNDGKPMKTRAGDNIGLESLIDEAIARSRVIVDENDDAKKNGPELDEEERSQVAEAVGIGGIKFADLHHNRESDYKFSWDKMLAQNGDTATYIQYAYARINGIFRKGNEDRDSIRNAGHQLLLSHSSERALALQLVRFPEVVAEAVEDYRPNLLTSFLLEAANTYSAFYNESPVLTAENDDLRYSRLLLCDLTARVLSTGLSLLGIETCERM